MYNLMASNTQTAASAPEFPWWIVLVEGIFALIFGIFLIAEPAITSVFLVTVLGFYWLIRGIFSIIQIFVGGSGIHWGWLLFSVFFFNDTATTEIYTLSLHDALPI